MRLRTVVAPLIAFGLLAMACANSSVVGPGDGGGIAHPTGPDQLILRVDTSGGFVPPTYTIQQVPGFNLYGDGTSIATGPQIEIYPQPALTPLIATPLTQDGIQALLQAAKDAGLFSSTDYIDMASTLIADAPTTTFTITADGQTFTTAVYALGLLDGRPDAMSPDEFAARERLLAFSNSLSDLGSWLPAGSVGAGEPYTTDEMRIYSGPYQGDKSLPQNAVDWPLEPGLDSIGAVTGGPYNLDLRCATVSGEDLATLMPLIEGANQLTPWSSGGKDYGLIFRPLLPDESGC